jgi:hypothetical protein
MTSRGLQILQQAHRELFNKEPRVYTIHAGLECGMLARGWVEVRFVARKGQHCTRRFVLGSARYSRVSFGMRPF